MESDENSSPDDETMTMTTIPQSGCDVLQLVPKKAVISSEHNAMYQPCTNTIIQLKQSSFSAFRDMSEMRNPKQQPSDDDKGGDSEDDNNAACAATSHASTADQQ